MGTFKKLNEELERRIAELTKELSAAREQLSGEIADRRRVEAELRGKETQLGEAERLSHTSSWAWNVDTGKLAWSREHFLIFGFDPDMVEPAFQPAVDRIHTEDRPLFDRMLKSAIHGRDAFDVSYRIVLPDGTTRYVQSLGYPSLNERGEFEYVGTVIDISERRRAEETLLTLIHVSRLSEMEQMGSALAHELNQPLTAIANYVEASRRCVELQNPTKAIENLGKATAQVNRTGEIIQHLRQFVQKGSIERRRESINEVIEEASALALIGATQQGIRTAFQLANSAPHTLIDKVQIQQVMVNLIRNSVDAMKDSDPRGLTIATHRAGAFVDVCVSDTGSGLSDEIMAKLFQPFVSTKPPGMGIGLSVSRSIVQAHGGDLWAEQNAERGATFHFTLPLGD
jgi:PAS domain S-box-containing protein